MSGRRSLLPPPRFLLSRYQQLLQVGDAFLLGEESHHVGDAEVVTVAQGKEFIAGAGEALGFGGFLAKWLGFRCGLRRRLRFLLRFGVALVERGELGLELTEVVGL